MEESRAARSISPASTASTGSRPSAGAADIRSASACAIACMSSPDADTPSNSIISTERPPNRSRPSAAACSALRVVPTMRSKRAPNSPT
jgi:hypothetical protein